jgi:hypothetical protein
VAHLLFGEMKFGEKGCKECSGDGKSSMAVMLAVKAVVAVEVVEGFVAMVMTGAESVSRV